jgi:hypothetical protein
LLRDKSLRVMEQEYKNTKRLRLDHQHFARFDERELSLASLHIVEAENKGLVRHHTFTISPKKLLIRARN